MRTGRDQIGNGLPRILVGHQTFTDEDGVGSGGGVREQVVWAAHARLGDLDDARRYAWGKPREQRTVDLEGAQVARVDPDHARTCLDGSVDLSLVVDLDEWGQPKGLRAFDQRHQRTLIERRNDEEDEVGAVRQRFPQLIRVVDEVFAQQRNIDRLAHRFEVG